MSIHYVRLTPFDKAKGALCRRFCVGGMLFVEGNWYEMDSGVTPKIGALKQGSGCPYFEIVEDAGRWREIVRRELAAAMGGPQAAALAELFASPAPPKSAPPKAEGEVIKSEFAGLKAHEVDQRSAARAAAADLAPRAVSAALEPAPAPEPEPEPAVEPGPDLESMTKGELLELADDLGIELDRKSRKADILVAIRKASK